MEMNFNLASLKIFVKFLSNRGWGSTEKSQKQTVTGEKSQLAELQR